jgi:hypothetical protein
MGEIFGFEEGKNYCFEGGLEAYFAEYFGKKKPHCNKNIWLSSCQHFYKCLSQEQVV